MSYYSFEKGKYGGPCGAIFPFFRTLNGISALGEDYITYVPAGYLKCMGQILSADQYPNLARILGVGQNCIYRKDGTTLQEPNDDGTGGSFQLPDLGSKYITGASNTGNYLNLTTTNPSTNQEVVRAGVEVEINSQGSTATFNYTGNFRVPGRSLTLTGEMAVISPPSSSEPSTVAIGQTLAHGHNTTFKIARRINYRIDALGSATWVRKNIFCGRSGRECEGSDEFGMAHKVVTLEEAGSDSGTRHRHYGTFPVKTGESKTASTSNLDISASSLSTVVNVTTGRTFKMDNIAPKFILCEYLIKY
jgi:microcystin-dependent protein